jgi:hypothetical protein
MTRPRSFTNMHCTLHRSTFSFSSVSVSQTTSPLHNFAPLLPGTPSSSLRQPPDGASSQTRVGLSTEPITQPYPVAGVDRIVQSPFPMISASPTALPTSPSGLGFTPSLENLNLSPGSVSSSYQSTGMGRVRYSQQLLTRQIFASYPLYVQMRWLLLYKLVLNDRRTEEQQSDQRIIQAPRVMPLAKPVATQLLNQPHSRHNNLNTLLSPALLPV